MNAQKDDLQLSKSLSWQNLLPCDLRSLMRSGQWEGPTSGLALGYAQCNLVVLPQEQSFDFLVFCNRNAKTCPVLEVTEVGSPYTQWLADRADLRTDLPRYRIYEYGQLIDETTDILSFWRNDLVAFLIGCSFTFESALMSAGLPIRHIEEKHNVPIYITKMQCRSAGIFRGPIAVTMRPFPHEQVPRAVLLTSRYSHVHGAPLHIGNPEYIGIQDLQQPDFGHPSSVKENETPVFWACGVTAQAVAMESKPRLMITHVPGHMFISDRLNEELSIL